MVHIHRGKGAKDRFLPLPEQYALQILRNYWAIASQHEVSLPG